MTDLTDKQKVFVQEYLVDLNATQAAIRAGYSEKTARSVGAENLTKPDIAHAIQEALLARAERTQVSQDYVLATIVNAVERCKQSLPVLDRKGEPVLVETPTGEIVPAFTFNAAAVLKGAELLGRHLGLFTDKVEHSVDFVDRTEQLRRAGEEVRSIFGERPGDGPGAYGGGLPH